jgi:hypothetical protein
MASQPEQSTAPPAKGKGKLSGRMIGTGVMLLPAIAVLMPSLVLLGISMAPTIVAYIVDRTHEKYLSITVGLLNVCGTLPALVRLWSEGQSYPAALRIAGDPFTMLVAYGAAAIGWAIYLAMPLILGHYYATSSETRLRTLRSRQESLVEAWGDEIVGGPPATSD